MSFDDPFQPGQVLGSLRDVVRELDGKIGAQRYMMLGALVRDHHLRRVFQEEPRTRRTRDFDFAVVVPDEAAYAGVLTTGEPAAGALAVRRRIRDLPVDILPIFHGGDQTKWAADGITWDLLGLLEAWEGSQVLDLGDGASVRIPTLPAMIALKIVAWGAREDRKDAGDLRLLLAAAVEEGEAASWESDDAVLLGSPGFEGDIRQVTAYRVGREVQTQLREDTLGRCRELLGDDGEQLWLAAESTVSPYGTAQRRDRTVIQRGARARLAAFTKGLTYGR